MEKKKSLMERIFEDKGMKFTSIDFPNEVKEYMKLKIPELINNLPKDMKNIGANNLLDYIEKYDEFPLLRTYTPDTRSLDTFEARLINLFNDIVDVKEFTKNLDKKCIFEGKIGALSRKDKQYKLSKKGYALIEKSFRTCKEFEDFEKEVFIVKLAETIGYNNLIEIHNAAFISKEGKIKSLKNQDLKKVYSNLQYSVTLVLMSKDNAAFTKYYKKNREKVTDPKNFTKAAIGITDYMHK